MNKEAFLKQTPNPNERPEINLKQIEKIQSEEKLKAIKRQPIKIGNATISAKEIAQHEETKHVIAKKREETATAGSGQIFEIKPEDVQDLKSLEAQLREHKTEN